MSGLAATGDLSVVGYAPEVTAGTYVSPTRWLFPKTNTLAKSYDFVSSDVMSGTRASARQMRTTYLDPKGSLGYSLFATHAAPILKPTFGADALVAALTADTVKTGTPVATAGGVSMITLTNTSTLTYTVGALIKINTGVNCEVRPIISITGNGATGTVIYVPQLFINAAAVAGTAVTQLVYHNITTNATGQTLPTISLEDNNGGLYSYKYPGVYVNKANFKAGKDDIAVSTDLQGSVKPVYLASPTAVSASAAELSDMLHQFSGVDIGVATYGDPDATAGAASYGGAVATVSTPGVRHLPGVQSFEIDWSNNLIVEPTFNLQGVKRVFPGPQSISIKMDYLNEAKRDAEWDDYLTKLGQQTTSFFGYAWMNTSVTSTEAPLGVCFYASKVILKDAKPIKAAKKIIGQQIEYAVPMTGNSGDLISVALSNADTGGAY